jgi:hypothetical protein
MGTQGTTTEGAREEEMNKATYLKAFRIVRSGGVKLMEDSTPSLLSFKVRQESGPWTEVWRRREQGGFFIWSCNAVDNGWGCPMYGGDKTKPFCSHTKACQLWLEGVGVDDKSGGSGSKIYYDNVLRMRQEEQSDKKASEEAH